MSLIPMLAHNFDGNIYVYSLTYSNVSIRYFACDYFDHQHLLYDGRCQIVNAMYQDFTKAVHIPKYIIPKKEEIISLLASTDQPNYDRSTLFSFPSLDANVDDVLVALSKAKFITNIPSIYRIEETETLGAGGCASYDCQGDALPYRFIRDNVIYEVLIRQVDAQGNAMVIVEDERQKALAWLI